MVKNFSKPANQQTSKPANQNFKNKTLFHGDNLDFLRAMNSNSIDLIATDPPFNKGRDFHATPDSLTAGAKFQDRWSWEKDVHQDWIDQITDDHPGVMKAIESARHAHSEGMGAFMCFMTVRLLAMKRVLKPTGSIYLHCDSTASHYLKAAMDAVFGRKNFRNEIIWQRNDGRGKGSQHKSKKFGSNTDTILFYAKSDLHCPIITSEFKKDALTPELLKKFNKQDERGRYQTGIPIYCSRSMGDRPNLCYEWRGFSNPHPSGWRLSKERLEEEYQKGNVVIKPKGKLERRGYLKDYKGVPLDNNWTDLPRVGGKENTGYPTQKPLALLQRIIKASTNAGDVVLDPFCGCATTLVASERLGRQWAGIDIWDKAHETVIGRLQSEGLTAPDGFVSEALPLFGDIHYTKEPPIRTDDGETATPFLRVKERVKEPEGLKMSRKEMYDHLITQEGSKCQGCDRTFDDSRYLELDHNTPRADGGINHISNRILLCSPCNRAKSHILTLSGLRKKNKKEGRMAQT